LTNASIAMKNEQHGLRLISFPDGTYEVSISGTNLCPEHGAVKQLRMEYLNQKIVTMKLNRRSYSRLARCVGAVIWIYLKVIV